jgi:hypothetical protein
MSTIIVSSTATNPTHHIKLSDGSTSLGFILRSGNQINPRAIQRRPRQNGQYSPFTQSDWSGGRGIKDAQSDRSRYADAKRAITRHGGTVMIGGQETYTTGYRQVEQYMPGKVTWQSLLTTNRYIAYQVTASASGNRGAIYMWIRRRGTPTSTLTVELCANNAGSPGTVLKTVTATTTNITDTISVLYEFAFATVQAVTSTTVYWVKVYTSAADSATNYWQVGTDAADTNNLTKASSDGSSWSACAYDLYFRMVDDTDQLGGLFFKYLGQVYFVTRPSGAAAPKLYINGDRGVATGTHSATTLQDTTKTWTTNEFAGAVVQIIEGTNSEWQTPYRTIASNTANTLTFSPAFPKAPVSADTIYVILGSNKWTEVTGHGLTVLPTAAVSAGEVCYFAQGDLTKMRKMKEFLSNTTWTRSFAEETNYATFLGTYRHSTQGLMVFKVNNIGNNGNPSFAQSTTEEWTYNTRLKFPLLFDDGEATTGWTFGTNVTGTADNTVYQTKSKSIKMVKAAGSATTTPFAYKAFTQYSVNAYKMRAVRFWILVLGSYLADGEIKVRFSPSTDCSASLQDVNVPTVTADEWTQVTIPYSDTLAGMKYMTSIGFISASNFTIYVDGIELVPAGSEALLGNPGEKITGVTTYGDPEVPWIFRTQSAGAVENGVFNPIPLKEMAQAENIHNGMGHTVHNVYLYFSFLHGLERFYRNNLDDVGPNRDEGLPDERRGFITSMQGYVGRFFENYDVLEGYSCIMESASGTDHHEAYRCDVAGKRIRNLFIQVVPGDTADRLWFTEGDDIAWLPLPGNTLKEDTDDTFLHTHEAVLETGWITGSESDAVKLFTSVKLFTENTTANRKVEWDYKKNDETAWTNVATAFTTPPVQEVTLNVAAKRIKLRFRLQTNDNTETPLIRAMFVSATTRPETRYTYTMNTTLEDAAIDLQGQEDTTISAATILAQLDTWMEANTVLTMSSVFSPFDNKTVFLEPVVTQPLTIIFDESKEKLIATLNLIEP